jgi:hypothetical protein
MKQIFTFLFIIAFGLTSNAQVPFSAGNIVVLRLGDGTSALTKNGNALFLDEYNPTTKVKVQSIALPAAAASGSVNPIILSGTAGSEGALSRSADGQYLALAGYSTAAGGSTALATSTGTTIPRVVGIVKYDGTINTSKTFTNFASGSNPRGAYTSDGNSIWMTGGVKGIQYSKLSTSDSAITICNKTSTGSTLSNFRAITVSDGQLFASTGSGSAVRVGSVGTGLPTDTGKIITTVPGLPVAAPSSPYAFWAGKTVSISPISNVLYITDDNVSSGSGGIKKYALNVLTSSWDSVGIIDAGIVYRSVTGIVTGTTVTLYAVRNSDSLVSIIDNAAFNAAPSSSTYTSIIAAMPTGTLFRGVALAPVYNPLPNNNFVLIAKVENRVANLSWSIENVNASSFVVEKSTNGRDFYLLKEVKATQTNLFKIIDNQYNGLANYYRVKAIQLNGSRVYSNTVVLSENNGKSTISVYPNPAQDFIAVNYAKYSGDATLKIVNTLGEVVLTQQILKQTTQVYLPIATLQKGTYSVVIYQSKNPIVSKQFVKQ